MYKRHNELLWAGTLPNLKYVAGEIAGGSYETPYIEGTDADVYLFEWRNDGEEFVRRVRDIIRNFLTPEEQELIPFQTSEPFEEIYGHIELDGAKSLRITNADMLFSNLKFVNGNELYNFDYEWVFDFAVPYGYVLWRAVCQLYDKYAVYLKRKMTKEEFLDAVGIATQFMPVYLKMENHFAEYVFGKNKCEDYLERYRKEAILQTVSIV